MGCFKNVLAMIGCFTVILLAGVLGGQYRAQIAGLYRSFTESEAPAADTPTTGVPSETALRSAERKWQEMEKRSGAGFVKLSAAELAALIERGFDPRARVFIDSIQVILESDGLSVSLSLKLELLGQQLLGPLGGILNERETVRMTGGARMAAVGLAFWEPDEVVIRSFPLPDATIRPMVNRLTGRSDGGVPIEVPENVGDLRIRPDGVTFYRRG